MLTLVCVLSAVLLFALASPWLWAMFDKYVNWVWDKMRV